VGPFVRPGDVSIDSGNKIFALLMSVSTTIWLIRYFGT
jgi:hypothetical protein